MLTHAKPVPPATEPITATILAEQIAALAKEHGSNERELRIAIAQRLKVAMAEARNTVEQQLLKDRRGRQCAERLCRLQDDIIRVLFEFATPRTPSAWRSSQPAATAAA